MIGSQQEPGLYIYSVLNDSSKLVLPKEASEENDLRQAVVGEVFRGS
jgi:hypothetical protein